MARTRHFALGPLLFSIGWLVIAKSAAAQSSVTEMLLPGLPRVSVPVVVLEQPGPDVDVPKEEPEAEKTPEAPKWFWETNPPVRIIPRLGIFQMPPTGPGYYSLRDW